MPSGARCKRTYTLEHATAWRFLPYKELIKPGMNLSRALHLYRARIDPDDGNRERQRFAELRAAHARAVKDFDALPDLCYKHEHPMGCGRPRKFYSKYDRLGPIIDAIAIMYERLGGGGCGSMASDAFGLFADAPKPKRQRTLPDGWDEQEQAEQAARDKSDAVRCGKLPSTAKWWCELCGNKDELSVVQSVDGRVCPCGAVLRGSANIEEGAEWRCHAEDDVGKNEAKKRTDDPRNPERTLAQREIEGESLSKEDRAAQRRGVAKQTSVGGRGLTDAQRILERERERELRTESDLTAREEVKRTRIVEELNKMFKRLKPIDPGVQREVRRTAHQLWHQAVHHANVCKHASCCELRLVDRNPTTIASSVFSHTVDGILGGEVKLDGVAREHVVDLQMRMQRSAEFSNTSSLAQMATAKSMISLMQVTRHDLPSPCVPHASPQPSALKNPRVNAHPYGVPLQRCDSDLAFQQREDQPSPIGGQLPLRNALGTVFLAHKSSLPASVRDGAMCALRAPGFVASCKALVCLNDASLQAVAFCVLNAVAREQSDTAGPSFAGGCSFEGINVPIAQKLKLDLAVAEEAIGAIRHFVPTDAASEASAQQEDDLFAPSA